MNTKTLTSRPDSDDVISVELLHSIKEMLDNMPKVYELNDEFITKLDAFLEMRIKEEFDELRADVRLIARQQQRPEGPSRAAEEAWAKIERSTAEEEALLPEIHFIPFQ